MKYFNLTNYFNHALALAKLQLDEQNLGDESPSLSKAADNAANEEYHDLMRKPSAGDIQAVLRAVAEDDSALEELREDLASGPMFDLAHAGMILREHLEFYAKRVSEQVGQAIHEDEQEGAA